MSLTELKQITQILVNIEWTLQHISADLMVMDKPWADQILKTAKELEDVIVRMQVEVNQQ